MEKEVAEQAKHSETMHEGHHVDETSEKEVAQSLTRPEIYRDQYPFCSHEATISAS